MTKRVIGVIVLLIVLLIAGAIYFYWRNLKIGANEPQASAEVIQPAYFKFTDGVSNFIFKLNDQYKIAEAREMPERRRPARDRSRPRTHPTTHPLSHE